MSIRPTFAGFYTARSGLVSSQTNLNVTGQNIANINTGGYTRQRADLLSIGDNGYKSRLANPNGLYIGQGVNVAGISQLRDSSLDVRFRRENTKFAYEDTKLSGLEDLEKIFDETQAGGMEAKINDFIASLQKYSENTSSKELAGIVQNQAILFAKSMNQISRELNNIDQQQKSDFQITVDQVNTTIQKISDLNRMIKEDTMYGNPSLELKDNRNLLLDELSGYMNIDYHYDSADADRLIVNFVDADGNRTPLIDGKEHVTLDLEFGADGDAPQIEMTYDGDTSDILGGGTMDIENTDTGAIGAYFDVLTGNGIFGDEIGNRGIPYYKEMMDTYATKFATAMNDLNRGKIEVDATTGNPNIDFNKDGKMDEMDWLAIDLNQTGKGTFDTNGDGTIDAKEWLTFSSTNDGNLDFYDPDGNLLDPLKSPIDADGNLTQEGKDAIQAAIDYSKGKIMNDPNQPDKGGYLFGTEKNLFASTNGEPINAGNITISDEWVDNKGLLTTTLFPANNGGGSVAADNINRFLTAFKTPVEFTKPDGDPAFTGTFNECVGHIASNIGMDVERGKSLALSHSKVVINIDNSRLSVSSVDENEEISNSMMFTKAFNASSRLMTALDEALDTLINRTGMVGR